MNNSLYKISPTLGALQSVFKYVSQEWQIMAFNEMDTLSKYFYAYLLLQWLNNNNIGHIKK